VAVTLALCIAGTQPARKSADLGPPVTTPLRFLLRFDDGPRTWEPYNPTRVILDQLQHNTVQPEVKAISFRPSRGPRAGGGATGHALLRRIHGEGHVLASHSGSAPGHVAHTRLSDAELDQSLRDGIADIEAVTGEAPSLVRPPFWQFDERTLVAYPAWGLLMLLTDINARDGKIHGWTISLRRRAYFEAGLTRVRYAIQEGTLQMIDGVVPVHLPRHQDIHRQPHAGVPGDLGGQGARGRFASDPPPFLQ
jgi:peptidoglycan/xylan/chitin deacetylase (PgdA/CDA1 family)